VVPPLLARNADGINRERYSKMRMRTIAEAEAPEAMATPRMLVGSRAREEFLE
jgi:hypothetical protein